MNTLGPGGDRQSEPHELGEALRCRPGCRRSIPLPGARLCWPTPATSTSPQRCPLMAEPIATGKNASTSPRPGCDHRPDLLMLWAAPWSPGHLFGQRWLPEAMLPELSRASYRVRNVSVRAAPPVESFRAPVPAVESANRVPCPFVLSRFQPNVIGLKSPAMMTKVPSTIRKVPTAPPTVSLN
jgi:hypothetical protein